MKFATHNFIIPSAFSLMLLYVDNALANEPSYFDTCNNLLFTQSILEVESLDAQVFSSNIGLNSREEFVFMALGRQAIYGDTANQPEKIYAPKVLSGLPLEDKTRAFRACKFALRNTRINIIPPVKDFPDNDLERLSACKWAMTHAMAGALEGSELKAKYSNTMLKLAGTLTYFNQVHSLDKEQSGNHWFIENRGFMNVELTDVAYCTAMAETSSSSFRDSYHSLVLEKIGK